MSLQVSPSAHTGSLLPTQAPAEQVDGEVFNVGADDNNLRIQTLAYRIRDRIPGTQVVMLPDDADQRSYRVSFAKLKAAFPDLSFAEVETGVDEIVDAMRRGLVDPDDQRWYTVRHYQFLSDVEKAYEQLSSDGRILG